MLARLISFFLALIAGAGVALLWALIGPTDHAGAMMLTGALAAAVAWVVLDAWRAHKVRCWLRVPDPERAPAISGWWGVLLERVTKLTREHQRTVVLGEQRLTDFLSAIQASPNGVVMLDANTKIEWCNHTAAMQLGIHSERDLGQRIGNLLRDPDFTAYMALEQPLEPVVMNGRNHKVDRPVRVAVQRHRYGEGKQLLLTRDITLIEQAEAMRRDFVANVSHEIRTPLTVLSGFIETIQTLPLSADETQHYAGIMAVQAERMRVLVDDLLTLSRIEASPAPSNQVEVQLQRLLASCEQEAKVLSATVTGGTQPHAFDCEMPPQLAQAVVIGDERDLQSAVSNLMSNAVRYTPAGGRIGVQVAQTPDGVLTLVVTDSGVGIAPEHLPRLTERFYRVDRSRSRESGGTGLGLAIVKHVMQRYGGQLCIASTLGQGSSFTLVFPATRWRLQETAK